MLRILVIVTAGGLVIGPALLQGLWTGRWSGSRELEAAAARLERVPLTVGDWQGEPAELDDREVKQAELAGHVTRRYQNRRTGSVVAVVVMCGRPGPVSVHTPDVCYRGAGYGLSGPPLRFAPDPGGIPAEFWTVKFRRKKPVGGSRRRIFWAWNADGRWQAPDNPRLTFARFPALYKLYVIRELSGDDEPLEEDPCKDLMQQLLPELDKVLFPAA
jgi:hypothetical protein